MRIGKRILINSTSFRRGGNSDSLADEFAKGSVETGKPKYIRRLGVR